MSRGCKWPWTRTCGGVLVVKCKSLPPFSRRFLSKSLKLAGIGSPYPSDRLVDRLARDLFQCGQSGHRFDQPASTQSDHAVLNRLLLQFHRRSADENELLQLVVDLHHLVETSTALV